MDTVFGLIRKIDVVGFQVRPLYNGSNRMKTVLGGLLSGALISLTMLGFIYFGREMILKSSPSISSTKRKVKDAEIMLEDSPFFIFAFNRAGNHIIEHPQFQRAVKFSAEIVQFRDGENGGPVDLLNLTAPIVKCSHDQMKEEIMEVAKEDGYIPEFGLCIDYKNTIDNKGNKYSGPISVKNEALSIGSTLILIKVNLCDESEDPGCREFLDKLGKFWINTYIPDNFEDPTDYAEPIKKTFSIVKYSSNRGFSIRNQVNLQINELTTDKGVILEDKNTESYTSISDIEFNVDSFSETDRLLYQLNLSVREIKYATTRKYLKFQELLANVGGFIKASIYLATAICHKYSEFVLFSEINTKLEANKKTVVRDNFVLDKDTSSNLNMTKQFSRATVKQISFSSYVLALFSSSIRKQNKIDKTQTFRFLDLNYIMKQMTKIEENRVNS